MFLGRTYIMNRLTYPALMSAILVTPTATHADDKDSEKSGQAFSLDTITINSTLTEQSIEDVANTVSIIDSIQVEQTLAADIRDLIRYEPGVDVNSAGRFGFSGFTIRGLNGNRVKILVDGVEQPKSFEPGGSFLRGTRNFFDIDTLSQVEILKGPASSLYGSDALGGVVAFRTKEASDFLEEDENFGGRVKAGYNEKDKGTMQSVALANRFGSVETLFNYTHREGEEITNYDDNYPGGTGDARLQKDPVDYSSDNFLGKVTFSPNDNHKFILSAEMFESETQTDLLTLEGDTNSPFIYEDYTGDDTNKRTNILLKHEWRANTPVFDHIDWQIAQQSSESIQETRNILFFRSPVGTPRFIDYFNKEDTLQASATFSKSISNHFLTYGISYKDQEFENQTDKYYLDGSRPADLNRYTPFIDGEKMGIFSQFESEIIPDKLSTIIGLRYDSFEASTTGDDRLPVEFTEHESDKVTGRLGMVYKFNDNQSVFAQYNQGFKSPDILELYFEENTGRGYLIAANPELKPEESENYEIGFRHNNDFMDLEIVTYQSKFENFISQTSDFSNPQEYPAGIFQYNNIATATIEGLEVRGSFWLDAIDAMPTGSRLIFSFARTRGKDTSDSDQETPLPNIAPYKLVTGFHYDQPAGRWGSALTMTTSGKKHSTDVSDEDQFAPPGYTVWDLNGYYNITDNLTAHAGVFNLTDKEYWDWGDVANRNDTNFVNRYTSPGRHLGFSISYNF